MWEIIRKNKRRSWMLLGVMGLLLVTLGFLIGAAVHLETSSIVDIPYGMRDYGRMIERTAEGYDPGPPPGFFSWTRAPELLLNGGGMIGIGVAVLVWCLLAGIAFFAGDKSILWTAGARRIDREAAPRLWNLVEEMTIAAGLPKPPKVYLVDDDGMNAFAVGTTPEKASVAVTTGLARRLNRDELQGVIGHEIAHIHNYDARFMTLASVMVGSIVLISDLFLRTLRHYRPRRSSSKGGGVAQVIMLVLALVFAIIAPILAHLLYLACSRRREYLADACSARFTRYPPGLASALEKLGRQPLSKRDVNRAMAPLYIVNPLQPLSSSNVFSSHPPLEKRIAVLRAMAGAGFAAYEQAYERVSDKKDCCFDSQFLKDESGVTMRAASEDTLSDEDRERGREALDVVERAAEFIILTCPCGVRLKVPPAMDRTEVECPRCGRAHEVPHALHDAATAAGALAGIAMGGVPLTRAAPGRAASGTSATAEAAPMHYQRTGTGWESFRCACGKTVQISPSFGANFISCRSCGRHIRVLPLNSAI